MLSSCWGIIRNNANAFGNCCHRMLFSCKLTSSSHYTDSPTQRVCISFHVEQRRAWWGNIKLVLLTKSSGNGGRRFLKTLFSWLCDIKSSNNKVQLHFSGLDWPKWLIVSLKSLFFMLSKLAINHCPSCRQGINMVDSNFLSSLSHSRGHPHTLFRLLCPHYTHMHIWRWTLGLISCPDNTTYYHFSLFLTV